MMPQQSTAQPCIRKPSDCQIPALPFNFMLEPRGAPVHRGFGAISTAPGLQAGEDWKACSLVAVM